MKLFKVFAILGVTSALAFSCKEKENFENEELLYEISVTETDKVSVDVQEISAAGKEIPVTVTVAEGAELKVTSVLFNGTPCEFVSEDGNVYKYKFTMPASAVTISVKTSETAFSIYWDSEDSDYSVICTTSKAEPGEEVSFSVSVINLVYKVTSVSYGSAGEFCEQVGDPEFAGNDATVGPLVYDFKFTMPERDVTLNVTLEESLNKISRTSDPNANIRMLNRLYPDGYNPDIDEDIENEYDRKVCKGKFGQGAYFVIDATPGYVYDAPVIKGKITGNGYTAVYANHEGYGECYGLTMLPAEPIDITITAREENIYEGKPFVKSYDAFWLKVRTLSYIYSEAAPTMEYELMKNTTYSISSTDENKFSGLGFYSFDESANTFAYDYDKMKDNLVTQNTNAGLDGRYGDEISFVSVVNIAEPIPDNTRYYIAAGDGKISDFISASANGNLIIMSFKYDGEQRYYIYNQNEGMSLTKVDVVFEKGSTLADQNAEAVAMIDGTPVLKYTVEDGKPVLSEQGSEAGTYTGDKGDLVLDGFGGATLGGVAGSYVLDGTTVIFKDNSENETKLMIDVTDKTYSLISDSGEWDGPMQFSVESPNGIVGGQAKKALISLSLEGRVFFRFAFDNYGKWEDAINTDVSYIYDASAQTLTISFLNWLGNPTSIEQADGKYPALSKIVFKVSSDKKSLEFTGIDTLYARWNENSLSLDGVVLTAVE